MLKKDFEDLIITNKSKTYIIILFFPILLATISYIYGSFSQNALYFSLLTVLISGLVSFSSYYWGDKIILSFTHSRLISELDYPKLFTILKNLCIKSSLPIPKIYINNEKSLNVFAIGRNPRSASICFTKGIIDKLSEEEIEAVSAHELSHIKNFDIRLGIVISVLVGSVILLLNIFFKSNFISTKKDNNYSIFSIILVIFISFLTPLVALAIQMSISRKREFLADAYASFITKKPNFLADALEKISLDNNQLINFSPVTAHLYIFNPLKIENNKINILKFFDTHPSVSERIKILRSL